MDISIAVGYNKIPVSPSVFFKKGTILVLTMASTGVVAINPNSLYPDFYLTGSTLTYLNYEKIYAFYINALTATPTYFTMFNIQKYFSFSTDEINVIVNAKFFDSTSIVARTAKITNSKYISVIKK